LQIIPHEILTHPKSGKWSAAAPGGVNLKLNKNFLGSCSGGRPLHESKKFPKDCYLKLEA
jgi:hypothetical protein